MFFYDFLRISRRTAHCPDFLVNIEDTVFAAFSSVAVFYVTYLKNNGELRLQTAIGLLIGCVLYILIIRDSFVRLGCIIVRAFIKIFIKILFIIIKPILIILKVIMKPARVVFWYTGKGIRSARARIGVRLLNIRHIAKKK